MSGAESRGIETVFREMDKSGSDALLRRAIEVVEDLLRFVGDNDAIGHSPRSRSY